MRHTMRVIAYLVALIYAHSAIAGLPPTKLGGQSGTAFTNFNFLAPELYRDWETDRKSVV